MLEHYERTPTLLPYYEALERLVNGAGKILPKGTKITLNAVALEAGKTEGSIKKSRSVYANLIEETKRQSKRQQELTAPGVLDVRTARAKTAKAKAESDDFEDKYKASLARELMLLVQLDNVEEQLRKIDRKSVV